MKCKKYFLASMAGVMLIASGCQSVQASNRATEKWLMELAPSPASSGTTSSSQVAVPVVQTVTLLNLRRLAKSAGSINMTQLNQTNVDDTTMHFVVIAIKSLESVTWGDSNFPILHTTNGHAFEIDSTNYQVLQGVFADLPPYPGP